MMEKLMAFTDYFRKIPVVFLVAIVCMLGIVLFIPEEYANILAVDGFRNEYRVFLGPVFLLTISLSVVRVFDYFVQAHNQRQKLKEMQKTLHNLTPEEKGYLVSYIKGKKNTVYVGMEDGIMAGLHSKGITYLATNMGDILDGFAFNLHPWARDYLEQNSHLLNGYAGFPMTPSQKLNSTYYGLLNK